MPSPLFPLPPLPHFAQPGVRGLFAETWDRFARGTELGPAGKEAYARLLHLALFLNLGVPLPPYTHRELQEAFDVLIARVEALEGGMPLEEVLFGALASSYRFATAEALEVPPLLRLASFARLWRPRWARRGDLLVVRFAVMGATRDDVVREARRLRHKYMRSPIP